MRAVMAKFEFQCIKILDGLRTIREGGSKITQTIDIVKDWELGWLFLLLLDRVAGRVMEHLSLRKCFPPSLSFCDDTLDFIESTVGAWYATLDDVTADLS